MDITPQEAIMIQAFREAGFPPLYVLVRVRNDIANDPGNVSDSQKEQLVKTLEAYIAPLWENNRQSKSEQQRI